MEAKQQLLAEVFKKLDERGCKVMLSNSCTDFILDLYKDYKNTTHTVYATRMINSKGSGRGKIKEVVITNYVPDTKEVLNSR